MNKLTRFALAGCVTLGAYSAAPARAAEGPFDWPMWGRNATRQTVTPEKGVPTDWDVETNKNIKWVAKLGSQSYGNPVIAGGLIAVGTNNTMRDPKVTGDTSYFVLIDEKTGKVVYERQSPKLEAGRVNDWPYQGVCSTACFEGDLVWYCTPRCEVVCLDVEPTRRNGAAPKEVWVYDMMKEQGVFPHNMTACSTAVWNDYVYIITGNGVDETHKNIPAPQAPSVICFEKKTGKVVWTDNTPGNAILHGQYSSPAIAEANGRGLVICPLGDGWVYAYDAKTGKIVWRFDSNNKSTTYPTTRNELIATPVVVGNLMYIANGQDPEHGEGEGHMWCVDITKEGDVSLELAADEAPPTPAAKPGAELIAPAGAAKSRKGKPNPNSAVVWHFEKLPNAKPKVARQRMNRTISSTVVADGLAIVPDLSGYVHCFDAKTGQPFWIYNMDKAMWGSPLVADGHIYVCDEGGTVAIIPLSKKLEEDKIVTHDMGSALTCSPVFANGTLYLMTRDKLFAISDKK